MPRRQILLPQPRACAARDKVSLRGRWHLWCAVGIYAAIVLAQTALHDHDFGRTIVRALSLNNCSTVLLIWPAAVCSFEPADAAGSLAEQRHSHMQPWMRQTNSAHARPTEPFDKLRADCCDGTDEPGGRCKNTCSEQGAAARTAMKAKLKARACLALSFASGLRLSSPLLTTTRGTN